MKEAVGSQITNLVKNLTKKNYRQSASEIDKLVQANGIEAYKFLLRLLLKEINFHNMTAKDQAKQQLLTQEFAELANKTNFATLFVDVFEGINGPKADIVAQFSKALGLPIAQQVVLALGLAQSTDTNTQQEGINFLKSKLSEILENASALPENIIFHLLHLVSISPDFAKEKERVLKTFEAFKPQLSMAPQFSQGTDLASSKRNLQQNAFAPITLQQLSDLAGVMKDLGYVCLMNEDIFSKILLHFPAVTERDIGICIGVMAMTHTGLEENPAVSKTFFASHSINVEKKTESKVQGWNIPAFVNVVKKKYPQLSWFKAIQFLDFPLFRLSDQKGFATITAVYKAATDDLFPIEAVITSLWQNRIGQLSLISAALDAPPDLVNFAGGSLRQVNLGAVANIQRNSNNPAWLCLDLINVLLELADEDTYQHIRKLFDYPMKTSPEHLVIGLAEARPRNIALQRDLLNILLPTFIRPHKNSFVVLHQLYQLNPALLVATLSETYNKDPSTLRRILDIAQELKALVNILDAQPMRFSIDLATLAAKRDHLNLEHWLLQNLDKYREVFANACLEFLQEKLKTMSDSRQDKHMAFPPEFAVVFARCLQAKRMNYPELTEQLQNLGQVVESLKLKPEAKSTDYQVSEETEEKANDYFRDIFNGKLSIDEAIELFKNLKGSKTGADQELFACMIHNLFDEYRFFNQYPAAQLKTISKLFGSVIQHNIITGKTLRVALMLIVQALSDTTSKYFQFAVIAISFFKTKLPEWPQFCQALLAVPSLSQHIPDINYYLTAAPVVTSESADMGMGAMNQQTQQPQMMAPFAQATTASMVQEAPLPSMESPQVAEDSARPRADSSGTSAPQLGFQLDISTLTRHAQEQKYVEPDEQITDQVHFLINNLSANNLNEKANEAKKLLKQEYLPYLASYMVVNRGSLEPNFHALYAKFLDALKLKDLDAAVLKQTYDGIKVLLDSEKIRTVISERSLLKNLGSWLGMITIAKNKPILQKDLDLKQLLLDAYDNGKLIAVIPFVAKVLNHCAKSKVFKYPNPWLINLLSLLAEIHDIPDLKLNLKFEVEMLCKALKVKLTEIEKKGLLEGKPLNKVNNPDVHVTQSAAQTPAQQTPTTPVIPTTPVPSVVDKPVSSVPQFNIAHIPELTNVIPDLIDKVQISDTISIFKYNPALKKLVVLSLDRAIKEIIAPIVKRSVTIACRTTTELITKDFTLETDATKMKKAATMMVQNLAAKLAMVTSKDPLKASFAHHLKTSLQNIAIDQADKALSEEIDQAAQQMAQDNADLGCSYVEKAASEKAVTDINETLAAEYESRRKFAAGLMGVWTLGQPSLYAQSLPDTLYPNNGLAGQHLQVYEDFVDLSKGTRPEETTKAPEEKKTVPHPETMQKIAGVLEELFKQTKGKKNVALASLPAENEIAKQISQIVGLLKMSSSIADSAVGLAQSCLKTIYDTDSLLTRESLVSLLQSVKESFKKVAKSTTQMWSALDDEKKFNADITLALVRAKLIVMAEFDAVVANSINQNSQSAAKLAIAVIKKGVIEEKTIANIKLMKVMDALVKNAPKLQDSEGIVKLVETAKSIEAPAKSGHILLSKLLQNDFDSSEIEALRLKVIPQFNEWILINETSKAQNSVSVRTHFIAQLQRTGLLKTDIDFEKFCSVLIAVCVENYHSLSQLQSELIAEQAAFKYIDAFSELVGLVLKLSEESHKVNLLHKALMIVSKYLAREHEKHPERLNQRVYLRFFSNILLDISATNAIESPQYLLMLMTFSSILYVLQPANLPGFSFAWIELISHRAFMPKLLFSKDQKGWGSFHSLLVALFQFQEPYLRNAELTNPIRLLYRGTLKILLVLLHDFSEFLCGYHFSLCDVIPPSCIQMRNLILSAFPRNMRLPDPFTPNLKVDLLPEINQAPEIMSKYTAALDKFKLKEKVDAYLVNRNPSSFLTELKQSLILPQQEVLAAGTRYNVPLMNALVLHVGVKAMRQLQVVQVRAPIVNSPAMDIFQKLVLELDTEGRYLFLNSLANQLRYPNSHTHYFSCVLLYLFAEVKSELDEEIVQEQITRVLLERLIVNRPHPWGLLITFIELVKNPRYNFWEKKFIRCAPEIEHLFENVGRSCVSMPH